MRLYNSLGPNPRIVRMFAAERGITLPLVAVDTRAGENRQSAYLAINPLGQTPALALDDGTVLTQITAICEYLDETAADGPSLIGANPVERAQTRMWTRVVDLQIAEPMLNGFRYSDALERFKTRVRCMPQAAADLKLLAQEQLAWLDGQIAGQEWICGARFSLADIHLFGMIDFASAAGQPLNPALSHVCAHHARMKSRPSAAA